MRTVYGLFSTPQSAQHAVDMLRATSRDMGFNKSQIVVLSGEPVEGVEFSEQHAHGPMFPLAAMGGILGGFTGYALTVLTQKAYPIVTGGMPIATTWTNGIIVYELTMLGAILTTLITLLITAGLPNWKAATITEPEIWTGKILVGVNDAPASIVGIVTQRLRDHRRRAEVKAQN